MYWILERLFLIARCIWAFFVLFLSKALGFSFYFPPSPSPPPKNSITGRFILNIFVSYNSLLLFPDWSCYSDVLQHCEYPFLSFWSGASPSIRDGRQLSNVFSCSIITCLFEKEIINYITIKLDKAMFVLFLVTCSKGAQTFFRCEYLKMQN